VPLGGVAGNQAALLKGMESGLTQINCFHRKACKTKVPDRGEENNGPGRVFLHCA